jgi:serine/threonine-protein kinase
MRNAAAIHVCARPRAGADEHDEALLDDLANVLDVAEQALRETGFSILLQTGTTLLAARVLAEEATEAARQRDDIRLEAGVLAQTMVGREGAHPALDVEVRLHFDAAILRGRDSPRAIGGPVVDVGSWPADSVVNAGTND